MKHKDITQHQIEALKHEHNMSDAHTHQSQSPTQKAIVARLPELWYESERRVYDDIEREFVRRFFAFRNQPAALRNDTFLVGYAASVSTAIVAHYFARRNLSVAVIEPCFDNLVDLLKLAKNRLEPLPESVIHGSDDIYASLAASVTADVIYLTDPNNPTGRSLFAKGEQYWKELIRFCKDHGKLLMLDLCFAPFFQAEPGIAPFDLYALLEDSGVSYVTLEDTGKSWPIQDMKASIMKASADVYDGLRDVSTIYLLRVSPFALRVLTEYLQDAIDTGFSHTRDLIRANWDTVRRHLVGTGLAIQEPDLPVPVVWCKLPDGMDGDELKEFLEKHDNVHVVPGKYFFWSDPESNRGYVRLALARDPDVLEESMRALRRSLDLYRKHFA